MKRKLLVFLAAFASHAEAMVCDAIIDHTIRHCYEQRLINTSDEPVVVTGLDNSRHIIWPNENVYFRPVKIKNYVNNDKLYELIKDEEKVRLIKVKIDKNKLINTNIPVRGIDLARIEQRIIDSTAFNN